VNDSSIYLGRVTHHRYLPKVHHFSYRVMMFLLFLDELDEVVGGIANLRYEGDGATPRWRRFANELPGRFTIRRSDFLPGYRGTLDEAARAMHLDLTGESAPGRIAMLTNLRSLFWNFNPITVFFFYDGGRLVRSVAEVTNTPWNERHLYLLGPAGTTLFEKEHHVSPFLEMDGAYRLDYTEPLDQFTLSMTLHDFDAEGPSPLGTERFSAAISLDRHSLTREELTFASMKFPDMALRVSLRIYLQAARLFAKRVRYVPHPQRGSKGSDDVRAN